MKLLSLVAILLSGSMAIAHQKGVERIKARNYKCAELQQIVLEKGHVHMQGFGSLDVFAEPRSCPRHHDFWWEAEKSFFIASDKFSCHVGYKCVDRYETDADH